MQSGKKATIERIEKRIKDKEVCDEKTAETTVETTETADTSQTLTESVSDLNTTH